MAKNLYADFHLFEVATFLGNTRLSALRYDGFGTTLCVK